MKSFDLTLQKLRARGYWQIRFLPVEPLQREEGTKQKMREVLSKSSVSLRGWDYPHISVNDNDHEQLYLSGDHFEGWIDWNQFKEVLRLYENGQYIHLFGAYEDWWSDDDWLPANHPYKQITVGSSLEVLGVTYRMTEILLFLKNMFNNGFYTGDVEVEITLKNMNGRKLTLNDPRRFPLWEGYISHSKDIVLPKRLVKMADVNTTFLDTAFKLIVEVFEQFQWAQIPLEVIKQDQKNLLERKI